MALNFLDPLDQQELGTLKQVASDLRRIKPKGWSVIYSENEIIVRPADRQAGKFSIHYSADYGWSVGFFCRLLNIWNKRARFPHRPSVAEELQAWMQAEALVPTRRTRDES